MGTVTKGKGAIYIKTLIGIAFMYFFGLVCPTFGGMSQMGIKILGVFIGLIFMTCVGCDLFSSSLLALLAFVLHGYYKASELISGWIGSGVTFQLIFAGALCVYLRQTGAMDVFAKKLLSLKITRGRPGIFMFMLMLAGFLVSTVVNGAAFFLLVFFAALTSSISLMETIVSVLQDKLKWKRQTICLLVMGVALLMALPSTLGYGIWSEVTIFGYQILDFFDFFSNNLLMPIVALLTAVLIGWVVKPKYVIEEVSLSGTFHAKKLYCTMITYIVPVCMVIILLSSFLLDLSFDSHHFAAGWRLSAPVRQHFCNFADYRPAVTLEHSQQESCTA